MYALYCRECRMMVCQDAIISLTLYSDTSRQYSTDEIFTGDEFCEDEYCRNSTGYMSDIGGWGKDAMCDGFWRPECNCLLNHIKCMGCGSLLGYKMLMPCKVCLTTTRNNGRKYVLYTDSVFRNTY